MELKNLDLSLLYRILSRVGEFREEHPSLLQTADLLDLVPEVVRERSENSRHSSVSNAMSATCKNEGICGHRLHGFLVAVSGCFSSPARAKCLCSLS
jgi:hypothetical protein